MKRDFWRQLDLYNPAQRHKVIVVGAGSIGSYLTFALARMGIHEVVVIDFDKVEDHNLPNQFFSEKIELPDYKIVALEKTINMILKEDDSVKGIVGRVENILTDVLQDTNIVCVTVDNMETRGKVFYILDNMEWKGWLVDARVGGQVANFFAINMANEDDKEYYKKTLYPDSETEELPCTARSVVDLSFQVAGNMATITRHILNGDDVFIMHSFADYKIGQMYIMINRQEIKSEN